MKLGEAIYKAQQSEGENNPNQSDNDDDTIVDADYEEVDEEKKS